MQDACKGFDPGMLIYLYFIHWQRARQFAGFAKSGAAQEDHYGFSALDRPAEAQFGECRVRNRR